MGPIAIGRLCRIGMFAGVVVAALSTTAPVVAHDDLLSRYAHWEQRLRERVDSLLVYPEGMQTGEAGDVLISFTVGPDGRPQQIMVQQSSGEPVFDQAAIRLVSNLGRIDPVPSATRALNRVALKLSYGEPCSRVRDCSELARTDLRERLANDARNRSIVSVTRMADGR